MRDVQTAEILEATNQTVAPNGSPLDVLNLLEALTKAQLENESLRERILFLTKQIEELRSQSKSSEFDYDTLAEKVFQRVQTSMPMAQMEQLDQIDDLLQMLARMRTADDRAHSGEATKTAVRPEHETEVVGQLDAIRDEIQRLSSTTR